MYKIEKRPSGFILTFSGNIDFAEMQKWYDDSLKELQSNKLTDFGVIIDMKNLLPIDKGTQAIMVKGQGLYKNAGMLRSAVVLADSIVCLQFKRLAKESGIYETERYIDASAHDSPISVAIDWVKDSVDPDLGAKR